MDTNQKALEIHAAKKGKIEVISKVPLKTAEDLSIAYTPGVAEPCRRIHAEKDDVYKYTIKGNIVAIVSDGTAVLGLGDIGPEAALPVMEGKAILFKAFGDVDAFPVCLDTKETEEIIRTVKYMAPVFGGINLEDIAAPRCFEIEDSLKKELDIPVFHDDQHGTAVVVLSGLINALKVVNKKIENVKITINGAGAAAIATAKLLLSNGVKNIIMCDSQGAIYEGRPAGMNPYKDEIARQSNPDKVKGTLQQAVRGADVFIGLSRPNTLTEEMVRSMNSDPIVFAMANPIPEIMPEAAIKAGVKVMATGRSDYPNQINNVLAFPGIFRGTFDVKASDINEEMKIAAAYAIASLVTESELNSEYIIPNPFDARVAPTVASAVAEAAKKSGIARK